MKVLLAAGGTAGHVNPALAAAGEIKKLCPEAELLFVGTADKIEARLAPQAGLEFRAIDVAGFQRRITPKNIVRNISAVGKLLRSRRQCKAILDDFSPDVAVGFGGYVSGPIIRMAQQRGIPTAIHEQNAYPGVTNRTLAKRAGAVMLTDERAAEHLDCAVPPVTVGLPVRSEIVTADREAARRRLGVGDSKVVLSFGGSLGAKTINTVMTDVMERLKDENLFFIHGYGKYGAFVPQELEKRGVLPVLSCRVTEYIDDMADCLAASDVVVCRAGASTIGELKAVGCCPILIPSPNVAENHQFKNAESLAENDAGYVIEEKDLTADSLAQLIEKLAADDGLRQSVGANIKSMFRPDSARVIAETVLSLGGKS
ncbi:MAG: undecaprenyldiphospho-muramoylpentapeptide beta-N-acetylglucosaminyltransferase [Clostridia bacterium]|nr:undecaprenyldiphospho-muramoylpentapeptide beta-N-acetylglucosaminyltransferase [Clostridia bacterium]